MYIKNHYGNSDVTLLESCCIGYSIETQIIAAIEEAKTSHSWVDVLVCVYVRACVRACVHACMRVCHVFVGYKPFCTFSHCSLHLVSLLMLRYSCPSVPQAIS